jgi:DNA adenine methylase
MTYDVADELTAMAKTRNFHVDKVSMKNTHHSTMQELVIGKDLSWVAKPVQ